MKRIPVHVITGFLGSGKTTLLNQLLRHDGFGRTAIIINEFGQTGLDHLFIEGREDGIFELSNGCLCCTIRGELAHTLLSLPMQGIDNVIVETTGLADPVPVLQAIISHPQVADRFEAASLTCLVDVLNGFQQLHEHQEARLQVALADQIIVTKLDMLTAGEQAPQLEKLKAALQGHNSRSPIIAKAELVLGPAMFKASSNRILHQLPSPLNHHHDVNRHGENIRTTILANAQPMPAQAIEMFCKLLTSAYAPHLLRLKGLASVEGCNGPLVLHAIHGVLHEPKALEKWPDADHSTRIVVILRDLDPDLVKRLFAGFANVPQADAPDRQALIDNPLAIAGHSHN